MGRKFVRADGRRAGTPTFYGGRWYRSRLESEYAQCWDSAGIAFSYETRRVQFTVGSYLPDFFLPPVGEREDVTYGGQGVWVEVKPAPATIHETDLCKELARVTGQLVYLCVGHPWTAEVAVWDGCWRPVGRMVLFGGGE